MSNECLERNTHTHTHMRACIHTGMHTHTYTHRAAIIMHPIMETWEYMKSAPEEFSSKDGMYTIEKNKTKRYVFISSIASKALPCKALEHVKASIF